MRNYESWIIFDGSGNAHGSYDRYNGGFDVAIYVAAYLGRTHSETYFLVNISEKKDYSS